MELINNAELLRAIAALAFVLALMLGLNFIMRRVNARAVNLPGVKRRLRVVESLSLDSRHRAVLLRRDDRDHLVILNPTGETVVEHGIAVNDRQD